MWVGWKDVAPSEQAGGGGAGVCFSEWLRAFATWKLLRCFAFFFFTDSTANQLPFSSDFFVLFKTQRSALRAVLGLHVSTLGV